MIVSKVENRLSGNSEHLNPFEAQNWNFHISSFVEL